MQTAAAPRAEAGVQLQPGRCPGARAAPHRPAPADGAVCPPPLKDLRTRHGTAQGSLFKQVAGFRLRARGLSRVGGESPGELPPPHSAPPGRGERPKPRPCCAVVCRKAMPKLNFVAGEKAQSPRVCRTKLCRRRSARLSRTDDILPRRQWAKARRAAPCSSLPCATRSSHPAKPAAVA